MKQKIRHIIIGGVVMLLMLAILLPTAVKFVHVFENHKHEVCINPLDPHIHEVEVDCEFYMFKLNNSFLSIINDIAILKTNNNHSTLSSDYYFINSYKSIGIALRGPPSYTSSHS